MTAISVTKARENIYQILSDVNDSSQPITITNNRGKNGVLISEVGKKFNTEGERERARERERR